MCLFRVYGVVISNYYFPILMILFVNFKRQFHFSLKMYFETFFNFSSLKTSSHWRCSVRKCVLKNFVIFTRKHLRWSLFLIKLQAFKHVTLLKGDSNTGVFVWYCKIFKNSYFGEHLRTTASINNNLNFNFVGTWCRFDLIQFLSNVWFTFFEMIYLYLDTWFTFIWFTFFGLFEYPDKECQSWIKDYFPYFLSSCTNITVVFKNIFFAEIHQTKRQTKGCPRFSFFFLKYF